MLSPENISTLNNLSFKQVARLWRQCGYRGDYMKKGGIAYLRGDIITHYGNCDSVETASHNFAADIIEAFPQGVFVKGPKRSYTRAISPAITSETDAQPDSSVEPNPIPADKMAQLASLLASLTPSQPVGVTESRIIELSAQICRMRLAIAWKLKSQPDPISAPRQFPVMPRSLKSWPL